ncbi:MAG TPA: rod shape-determining protein MreC [Gaiellaceae bacterium]|nr:rod shape-determining protein MreC [Gaiellaceae bacterium]
MPRQRTARLPVLDASLRRPDGLSPRTSRALRARLVALTLVLISLALITVYFRESDDGTLHSAQRIGLSVAMPFEVAGERIARPFRDAWGWVADLVGAKQENKKLRKELQDLRSRAVQEQTALSDNEQLRRDLQFRDGPRFPQGFNGVATRVVGRPPSAYNQEVLIAAGTSAGVRRNDPVVTPDGLVGLVTEVTSNGAQVTLLTDQQSAVSATVLESGAAGIVRHGSSDSSALILDRVGKDAFVETGDLVITAGWRTGKLESLYPRGIPIGTVKSVGQQDVDLYKRIQVTPLVNFDSLSDVIVLVSKNR